MGGGAGGIERGPPSHSDAVRYFLNETNTIRKDYFIFLLNIFY